jgi:hypothetical protein
MRLVEHSTGKRLANQPKGWDKGAARSRLRGRLADPYLRRALLRGADMSASDRDRAGAFENIFPVFSAFVAGVLDVLSIRCS